MTAVLQPGTPTLRMLVKQIRREADDVRSLLLVDPTGGPVPQWTPGSHIDVVLADGQVRQYSLAGQPGTAEHWRIAVLREAQGRGGSRFLCDSVRPGDILRTGVPRNHFELGIAPSYCLIAGGIGITPILPMVAALTRRGADWRLFYGGRSRSSMAFVEELARHEQVRIVPQDEEGLLDVDAIVAGTAPGTAVYCCGPAPLIDAVQRAVAAHGSGRLLHVERFSAVGPAQEGPAGAFDVVLARTGTTVRVPPGRSVLEVLADAGVAVPSSCESGICGSCETRVLGGRVDHRDAILTDAERVANTTMFVCVSRAEGPELILDR